MAYPDTAGYKVGGTSQEAAQSTDAATLRDLVLERLVSHGDATADEIAVGLNCSRLAIRPRVSELRALDALFDSGQRRCNSSGKSAIVWSLTRPS